MGDDFGKLVLRLALGLLILLHGVAKLKAAWFLSLWCRIGLQTGLVWRLYRRERGAHRIISASHQHGAVNHFRDMILRHTLVHRPALLARKEGGGRELKGSSCSRFALIFMRPPPPPPRALRNHAAIDRETPIGFWKSDAGAARILRGTPPSSGMLCKRSTRIVSAIQPGCGGASRGAPGPRRLAPLTPWRAPKTISVAISRGVKGRRAEPPCERRDRRLRPRYVRKSRVCGCRT